MRRTILALSALLLTAPAALSQTCKKEDFAGAVDQAGASLRKFNLDNQPKLNAKLEALRAKKGWKKTDSEDKALEYLQDGRIAELDAQSNELLTKIDALGRVEEGKPADCGKLSELKAAGVELLAVMKAKSSYTLEKIELEIQAGGGAPKPVATAPPAVAPKAEAPKPEAPRADAPKTEPAKPADNKLADVKVISKPAEPKMAEAQREPSKAPAERGPERGPERAGGASPPPAVRPLTEREAAEARTEADRRASKAPPSNWETSSEQAMNMDPGGAGQPYGPPPGEYTSDENEEGYTLDEIRDATRGFFGTISTNLASVIEYSFSKQGRPTAYILGQEGGGAFLAGLRYGNGTLYRRSGGTQTQKIYWHGPSVGYDVGAEGSRTLFLIYKLRDSADLYRTFSGIDGSAYVVGGVGLTLLKGGPVFMAPIRSGVGLRLGANLGYLRFTPQPTWNPF
ncbi:MAG: EipA family protein [Hyphomicrobiaceae bacterium]|nr:EipA family protein [Hyphomicrobiaceae bacterium]